MEKITDGMMPDSLESDLFAGLIPAFQHSQTGESHLSSLESGAPASDHGFTGLPEEWVVERDEEGQPTALHPQIKAGYWRAAEFLSLEQISSLPLDS